MSLNGFRHLCEMAVEPDGLRFNQQTARAQPIREQSGYAGIRVTMEAVLESAQIPIQVDIGSGDAVTRRLKKSRSPCYLSSPRRILDLMRSTHLRLRHFSLQVLERDFPPIGRLEATGRQRPKSKELSLSDILCEPLATKSA